MRRYLVLVVASCGRIGFDPGAAVDADLDDGAPRDGEVPRYCNAVGTLVDDFEAPTFAEDRWGARYVNAPMSLASADGAAHIVLADDPDPKFSALETARTYDLRGSAIATEVVSTPRNVAGTQMFFEARRGDSQRVGFIVSAGQLVARRLDAPMEIESSPIAFDPALHHHWRLRMDEASGMVAAEVSADGASYTTLAAYTPPFDPQYAVVSLGAGTFGRVVNPGTAAWAHVNGGASEPAPGCPASEYRDDFDHAPHPYWQLVEGTAMCDLDGAGFVVTPVSGGSGGCELQSGPVLDLRDDTVSIEVRDVTSPTASTAVTDFSIGVDADNRIRFRKSGSNLSLQRVIANVVSGELDVQYSPTAQRVWRLRGTETEVIGETSADGVTWMELGRFPAVASRVYVALGAGNAGSTDPGTARFDNYNAPVSGARSR